ncbi:divalent-cation tolerance protein CutA [Shewanella baltica]|uniref:divalent-cation tolerance protein CutA n=1 Tax=Shewanella baltica TaxID=62322 RepID=UPI003CFD292C
MQHQYLMVSTTCPNEVQANTLARALVESRIAACVHISSPIRSIYTWEGKICEEQEFSLQIKCLQSRYSELEQLVLRLHPYQVPEIIAVPVTHGLPAYLDWIKDNTQP